jgi:hypothetical protein
MEFCKRKKLPFRNHGISSIDVPSTTNKVINGTNMILGELDNSMKNFVDGESYEILFHPGIFDPDCKSSLKGDRQKDNDNIIAMQPFLSKYQIRLISYTALNLK